MWVNYEVLSYAGTKESRTFSVPLTRKLEETFEEFRIFLKRDNVTFPLFNSELGIMIISLTENQQRCHNNPTA